MGNNKELLNLLKAENWDKAKNLIETNGDGARDIFTVPDSSGQNSLHIAIWKKAPESLTLTIIEASEETVTAKTKNQSTPLHFATFYAAPCKIIEALIRSYPLALDVKNEYGVTPRTYDLCKLDSRSKELLLKPTEYWNEIFVKETIARRESLKKLNREKQRRIDELEKESASYVARLGKYKQTEDDLPSKLRKVEEKLATIEDGKITGANVASPDKKTKRFKKTESDATLEKRIECLEIKLSEAINALDRKVSLASDTFVEEGW
eukprot:CAMPEP_0195518268 /NCGR_PEP_ID=MMETSP0794_2-20130614/12649_1 /TAXON_ID=515487 /ORGANISM="Stephanopyxis turris, Strain CCMP 815" /LENGTH=264 /DNA_ID=CAMNT_0040647207 /DNA_START=68 /DNA_END=859 /DNA_ORIENTATION=+